MRAKQILIVFGGESTALNANIPWPAYSVESWLRRRNVDLKSCVEPGLSVSAEACNSTSAVVGGIDESFPRNVATIILNFNGADDTIACVESLATRTDNLNHTIVLDNGSKDGDRARIEVALRDHAHLLTLPKNIGVAAGWNVAIKLALERYHPDFIFLLNNDTVVDQGVLDELIRFMEVSPDTGAAGPSIMKYGDQSQHQYSRYRDVGRPIHDRKLSGCALMIRREVFHEIGFFDEEFFAYAEESDFLERMNQSGWKSCYIPTTAKVYHKGAHTSSSISGFEAFHRTRNRLLYAGKNLDGMRLLVSVCSFFFKTLPFDLYHDLLSKDRSMRLGNRARGLFEGMQLFARWRITRHDLKGCKSGTGVSNREGIRK